MKKKYPYVSVITVNFNGKKYLKRLFDSLEKISYPKSRLELMMVDNGSTDSSVEFVRDRYKRVKIILNEVNSYCKANNLGIIHSDGEYVALLNNDTKVDKNWLIELIKVIHNDETIAAVGSKLLSFNGRIQNAGHYELPDFYWGERGAGKEKEDYLEITEVPSLCGASILYRRKCFEKEGFFDEDFVMYGEDVDMAFRLRKRGWKLVFVPGSIIYHVFHGTADEELSRFYIERNRLLFLAKHFPNKLSNALIGSGYFTVTKDLSSCGKLYSILPLLISKLIKGHNIETVKSVLNEAFEELRKILYYENDILSKEINNITNERNEIKNQLGNVSARLDQYLKEISLKESQLKEKDGEVGSLKKELNTQKESLIERESLIAEKDSQLNNLKDKLTKLNHELQQHIDLLSVKDNLLAEREKEFTCLKEELTNLSNQLRQRMDEVLIKDGQLIEQDTQITSLTDQLDNLNLKLKQHLDSIQTKDSLISEKDSQLNNLKDKLTKLNHELQQHIDLLSVKDNLLTEKERELTSYKKELTNLSNQLKNRMDEALIKDGQLIESKAEIDGLKDELSRLAEELATELIIVEEDKALLTEKETELKSYKDELSNLSNQLRSRMDEVLIKDGELIEKNTQLSALTDQISKLDQKLQEQLDLVSTKDNLLAEKETELKSYKDELSNLSNQLRSRMDEVLIKDGELIEKNTQLSALTDQISKLDQKLQEQLDLVSTKDNLLTEKETELKSYKEELSNLSNQLRSRMDEVLIKEGELIEKDAQINNLSQEVQQYINSIKTKEGILSERDKELMLLKEEANNISNQLHQKTGEVILKDGELNNLKSELFHKEQDLSQKNNEILKLRTELDGIYNSEGFRFILRPLWRIIWNTRNFFRSLKSRLGQLLWFLVVVILSPLFLFLAISFLIENVLWLIFGFIIRKNAPKRRLIPFEDLKVSLVIPNWNGIDCLKECLPSIYGAEGFKDGKNEVLVVDDGSTDGSVDYIRSNFPQVRIVLNKRNRGFGFTCNRGVKEAKNELIVLINNDVIVTNDFLQLLISHLRDEKVFAVTPKLYAWDRKTFVWGMHMGHFEDGYIRLWNEAETGNGDKITQSSPSVFAIGGAMVFRKRDFLWLGGFDEIYRPNCWEDIDISYRAWKRGLKVIYEPNSLMYHKGKATLTYERHKEIKNEVSFTWKNITDGDILREHLWMLPWHLFKGRFIFLKGLLWAFRYLPKTLFHRLNERRFIQIKDRYIFNRVMLYYRNFMRRGFLHYQNEKPNVLLVSRFIPYPLNAGGKIRIHTLTKLLSDRYNFLLLSLIDHEDELRYIPELKKIFTEIYPILAKSPLKLDFISRFFYPDKYKFGYSYSQELIDKFIEIQKTMPLDLIHIESNELLYLADYIKYIPVVYTEHDISILAAGRSYYQKNGHLIPSFLDYLRRFYFHVHNYKKLDRVITLSKEDERVLRTFFPRTDITLVPTGVDLGHFSFRYDPRASKKLIFIGHYRHYPNEDAIVHFSRKIFPLIRKEMPDVELLIVGSNPTPAVESLAREKNVTLIGEVSDVKTYLEKASVFVNSIRISAGIKGKVLEAMAVGVPVVSTTRGSCGIDAFKERDILIADSPRRFAKDVIRLLLKDELRKEIAIEARHLVEKKYDWHKIIKRLDEVYKSTLLESEASKSEDQGVIEEILYRTNDLVEQKIEQLNGLLNPEEGPDELHIELTYRCNSKCIMCDLWDYQKRYSKGTYNELSLDEIRRFVEESRHLQKAKIVVLSGGEPFLRRDIVDICGFFSKELPNSSIGILTNGMNTDDIIVKTKEILDRFHTKSLWLGSSLDGLGRQHDMIRGADGAFFAFNRTIERCKKELPGIKLSATFTLTPYNIDQLMPVKEFADKQGLDFLVQFAVPKEAREKFIWTESNLKFVEDKVRKIIKELIGSRDRPSVINSLKSMDIDNGLLAQLYYWSHLVEYQYRPQRFFKKCVAGSRFAMFNPYGDLFFCPILKDKLVGNIREEKFDRLWMSEKALELRGFIEEGACHCWLVCIVFPLLEKALNT